MPNWCYNRATFTHKDPEQITRLINAAKVGKLLNEFYPMPPELLEEAPIGDDYEAKRDAIAVRNNLEFGYPSWYEWSIDNWGTKWDISEVDEDYMEKSADGKTVTISFDTAWSPPLEWYDNISGFDINAYYYEPGGGFCGRWNSEDGDDQYEIGDNIEDVKQRIPSDILDEFGIVEELEAYAAEMSEEDDDLGMDDVEDSDEGDEK
jgi:Ferredoxin-like domain in Api92-like protein